MSLGKSSKGQGKGLTAYDRIRSLIISAGVSVGLSFIFYRSFFYIILTVPAGIIFFRLQNKKLSLSRKRKIKSQCKDALLSVSSAISAGYALENAIPQGTRSLRRMWGDDCPAVSAWERMEHSLNLHIPVEQVFMEYAWESGLAEMETLAGLVNTAKRTGGGLGSLIKTTAVQMEEGLMAEDEIQTKLTEKRMELYIMLMMPPGILLYLQFFSYDIIASLYEEAWGNVFMTACLFVYMAGWLIGMKLLNIEV